MTFFSCGNQDKGQCVTPFKILSFSAFLSSQQTSKPPFGRNLILNEPTPDQIQCVAGLTQASVAGEKLDKSLAVRLAVSSAAAVAPRRQAEASRPHVVGCHHCTCRRKTESRSGGGDSGTGCDGSNIPGGCSCLQCVELNSGIYLLSILSVFLFI